MLRPGNYRNCHGHLVFAVGGEPQLVVGDIPCLDANHAAPGRVAEIGHGGRLFGPRVPHHARPGADFLNDDAAASPAIFEDAPRWRIEVDPVGLRPDGDERSSLWLAPSRFGLVDVDGASEPGDRDGGDVGNREVAVQSLLEGDRMGPAVLHSEA